MENPMSKTKNPRANNHVSIATVKIHGKSTDYEDACKRARVVSRRLGHAVYVDAFSSSVKDSRAHPWAIWSFGDRDDASVEAFFGDRYMETLVDASKIDTNPAPVRSRTTIIAAQDENPSRRNSPRANPAPIPSNNHTSIIASRLARGES